MGFFDKIRDGSIAFFGRRASNIVVELAFRGKKYILEELNVDFQEACGALITVTLGEPPDSLLEEWMLYADRKQDGELRFYPNSDMPDEGMLMQIVFREAYCIHSQKVMQPQGAGLLTTLVISPHRLQVGNEEVVCPHREYAEESILFWDNSERGSSLQKRRKYRGLSERIDTSPINSYKRKY